ncbi:MAG TPA: tetratricopeptide repeat protein, partial [Tepidisphaeraceae bacterium]|nr:tetratricopeptide repeat protein [Tepidisphaeraceae bacterium]
MAPHGLSVSQLFDLAVQSHRGSTPEIAEHQYRDILLHDPGHVGALRMLGLLLATGGRASEAIELLRRATQLQPADPELHYNLAKVLKQTGEWDASIGEYRQAIALRPQFPQALNNLGNALQEKGNHQDALEVYHTALMQRPNYPEAHFNLGRLLHEMDQTDEAIAEYQRAIALRPQYPEAHNNLALALMAQQHIDEAIAAFREAIRLRPGYIEAMANLGNALKDRGEHDEAIACFRAAAAGNPDPRFAGNILMSLLYHPGYERQTIYREHVTWDNMYAQPLARSIRPHLNDRDPERRLRVGYVSPHLNEHVVGRYLMPLLEHHDHARFEIFCYNDSHREDAASRQIQSFSDNWRTIADLSEEQVAGQIRADRIDVLVDLTLHMNQNRLLVFARKPAPVQITWLGYPGTTGLRTMDYRISDPYLDPPGGDDD